MREDIYAILARRLCEERKKAGLTMEEISETAGITPSFVAYIEHNRRKASLATVQKLADALGITISQLFSKANAAKPRDYEVVRRITHLIREKPPKQRAVMLRLMKTISKELPGKKR